MLLLVLLKAMLPNVPMGYMGADLEGSWICA
jgi:hypothetical protein